MGKSGDGRAPTTGGIRPEHQDCVGSLRELDTYISSTPFASKSVSGTNVGVYGKERSSPKEVDEMWQKTEEIWHFITVA